MFINEIFFAASNALPGAFTCIPKDTFTCFQIMFSIGFICNRLTKRYFALTSAVSSAITKKVGDKLAKTSGTKDSPELSVLLKTVIQTHQQ